MLPNLPAFFEEYDTEPDKMIIMIISVKELLHSLMKFHPISQIYLTLQLHLPESHSQSEWKTFLRQHKSSSSVRQQYSYKILHCQLQNSEPSVVLPETVLDRLPFPTTYLCGTGCCCLLLIKSKYKSRLGAVFPRAQ